MKKPTQIAWMMVGHLWWKRWIVTRLWMEDGGAYRLQVNKEGEQPK